MNIVLLDTNIVSFIFKGDNRLQPYELYLKENILSISFMTVAELFQWASIRNWSAKRIIQMEKTLDNYLIFPCDMELCRKWGKVRAEGKKFRLSPSLSPFNWRKNYLFLPMCFPRYSMKN